VHGAHVYIADEGGVHVIDRATGKEEALLVTSGGIWSTVAIHQDRLFVGGAKGLHCFDLASRKELWTFATAERVASSPAVDLEGNAYFGCDDGKVRAVDPAGRELWSADTGTKHNGTPALADRMVLVGSFDRAGVVALEAATGKELWFFAVPDAEEGGGSSRRGQRGVRGTMVAAKDRVVFTSMKGGLYVIRTDAAATERLVYRFAGANGAPAVVGGSIYVRARPEGMKRPAEVFRLDPK
jgi:outer membrane protein assembly factor BamB